MVENVPVELFTQLMRTMSGVPMTSEALQQHLHQQIQLWTSTAQLLQLTTVPHPPLSPAATSSESSTSSGASEPSLTPPVPSAPGKAPRKSKKAKENRSSPLPSPSSRVVNDLNRNTYSDCEKKHFLDVAYENNWGTTVAANKFMRVWGKGPTRRMFYWWREQFKKEHDRDQKLLDELKQRRSGLSMELNELSQENQLLVDRAQNCMQQIASVDIEIGNLLGKHQKSFCSITGEACQHGDGLQEDPSICKFHISFVCDFCKMPFQKESTRHLHMKLCRTRYIVCPEQQEPPKSSVPPQIVLQSPPKHTSELTELAEQLIARLASALSQ